MMGFAEADQGHRLVSAGSAQGNQIAGNGTLRFSDL
jgi:hypothetical protein